MTFRESDTSTSPEVSQLSAFAAGPKRKGRVPAGPRAEPDEPVLEPVDLEETPALSEELLQASASPSEDPVRLYLKEIGKVSLLKAQEEVSIGQRIEVGQIALRRALGGIPLATARLLAMVDRVRHEEITLDEVILLPEGGEPEPEEVRPMLAAFARIRRLERENERLEAGIAAKKVRSRASLANYRKWIAENRAAIQGLLERLPLRPALVDQLVGDMRAHAKRMGALRAGKDLQALEREAGMARKPLLGVLREIEQHDRDVRIAKRELMEANFVWSCPWPSATSAASCRSSIWCRRAISA